MTVIAVPQTGIGAYAESRMVEDLRHHFGERPVKLVIITGPLVPRICCSPGSARSMPNDRWTAPPCGPCCPFRPSMSTHPVRPRAAPGAARSAPSARRIRSSQQRARLAACVPLIIAVGVQLIFFLQYWLPETSRFPTRHWWLTQLAPLASQVLTSSGQSQVDGPERAVGSRRRDCC